MSIEPPSYLFIQLGSNDLGKGKSCGLIIVIKRDIGRTRLLLPNTHIIWSEILMRRYWHVGKSDGRIIEKIRKRVNCAVNNFIKNEGHYVIKHPNIQVNEIELYRFNGTHLSDRKWHIFEQFARCLGNIYYVAKYDELPSC